MEYVVIASVAFDAGHVSTRFVGCDGDHGHHYVVSVELGSKVDADAAAVAFDELESDLESIKAELANRSLNLMLAPSDASLIGLASYVWQRLSMLHPSLKEVRVVESSGRTIALR